MHARFSVFPPRSHPPSLARSLSPPSYQVRTGRWTHPTPSPVERPSPRARVPARAQGYALRRRGETGLEQARAAGEGDGVRVGSGGGGDGGGGGEGGGFEGGGGGGVGGRFEGGVDGEGGGVGEEGEEEEEEEGEGGGEVHCLGEREGDRVVDGWMGDWGG